MKHFCEQVIEINDKRKSSSKEKLPVISAEKRGKDKEAEKVLSLEPQHDVSNKSPNLGERPDWIKAEKKEVRQIPGLIGIKV